VNGSCRRLGICVAQTVWRVLEWSQFGGVRSAWDWRLWAQRPLLIGVWLGGPDDD
jgi:hypothetical protein